MARDTRSVLGLRGAGPARLNPAKRRQRMRCRPRPVRIAASYVTETPNGDLSLMDRYEDARRRPLGLGVLIE
jgi:hypothetical protein